MIVFWTANMRDARTNTKMPVTPNPAGAAVAALGHPAAYRPDIDGLRAVAVLSVVIYHLSKSILPGGYVGVDIFFVISGFLITRNIWGEMQAGDFSLARFYLRRIRRIAPAFFVMTIITLLAGGVLLLPDDLQRLGRSALWGAFSLSNVFFWRFLDTSYFADSSDEEPLLHTWSLGVEEQFYFIWPAILILAILLPRRRFAVVGVAAVICAASYALGQVTSTSAPKFAYFMLPARAGELMVGALLALWHRSPEHLRKESRQFWLPETLAGLGFALIAYSLFRLNDNSSFPGFNAIYPCLGAAMVMLAGEWRSRTVSLLLTPRPMVFIGLISYSLYLWHWPILAFIRYFFGTVDLTHGILAVAGMAAVAVLSYRYVELPGRRWRARPARQVFALFAAPVAVLGALAFAVVLTGGFKSMIESSRSYRGGLMQLEQYTAPASTFPYNCQLSTHDPHILQASRCVIGPGAGIAPISEPETLLWGDSEAAHYIGVIATFMNREGLAFRNATHSACPPVFGPKGYGIPAYRAGCDSFRPYMQSAILSGRYKTVIMSGAWSAYDTYPSFRHDLQQTLASITSTGARVILIGQAPYFANYNRQCELRGKRVGGLDCHSRYVEPDPGRPTTDLYLMRLAAATPQVSYLDVRGAVCRNGTCTPYIDGKPVYYNGTHLSMSGSWRIGAKLLASPEGEHWLAELTPTISARPAAALATHAVVTGNTVRADFSPRLMPEILGGYTPGFPYHVRSQKNLESRQGPAGVVLEFRHVKKEQVESSIAKDLAALGFRQVWRGPSGDSIRMDFQRAGFPTVSVNVSPVGMRQMQFPDAVGIVYFRW